jgi:transcriptional regulator with XRE-family HTH domain
VQNSPLEAYKKLHEFYYGGFDYQTKEIAAYLGVSTRTIQNWMRGKTRPSEEQQKKIQTYLDAKATNNKKT